MRTLPAEYAVRNLGRSPLRLALSVSGAALVVLLVLLGGGFARGLGEGLRIGGGERNVILLGAGSEESVERSEIPAATAATVAASVEGIRRRDGQVYVSPEIHVALPVRVADAHADATADANGLGAAAPSDSSVPLVVVRGVTPAALLVHDRVQIVEGRFPRSGAEELMAGAAAATAAQLPAAALAVGSTLRLEGREWSVVGRFVAPGTVMEGELWTALEDIRAASKRESDSCAVLTLESAEFEDIDIFCKTRLDLELSAISERDYYGALADFYAPVRAIAWATALLVLLGGMVGGLNLMHAAFARRLRELATLRCLGFRRRAIVASLAQESLLVALAGTLPACLIGAFLLDGVGVRFSMGVVALRVDAPVLLAGLAAGFAIGVVGALPTAWKAFRLSIPEALRH